MDLPFRVTICGLQELPGHSAAGVTHVLSIVDPTWPSPPDFGTYGQHARLELRFMDVIEENAAEPPREEHVARLLHFGRDLAARMPHGAHLLVHCHAGVSRSSASLALLLAQAMPERSGEEIFAEILRIRPGIWPNLCIVEIGDSMLQRDGALVRAAHGVYRRRLRETPELIEQMRTGGRAREVTAALGGA